MHADLAAALTLEQRAFVGAAGTRRALPTTCHVGHPGGQHVALPEAFSAGLRADLVERALDALPELDGACAWLSRGGALGTTDADLQWFSAALQGFGRHGLSPLAFAVMNRTAWTDLVSGATRQWRRVRARACVGRP